jgi:hypothetical protein
MRFLIRSFLVGSEQPIAVSHALIIEITQATPVP